MYEKISGMTGTAQTSAEEFDKVYGLEVASIPPNKPVVRKDMPDLIFKNAEEKYKAVIEEIRKRSASGQPVLLGTSSIEKNELLSRFLKQSGISHEVLNARNHEREGAIIAQAGKPGAVTVATNMAGRGVDIVLGGNPPLGEDARKVRELGGLHVIGTDKHEARRIDNQLRGRSGRQGDPGSTQFFLSLEDELLRIFGGDRIKSLMEGFKLPEGQPIESSMVTKAVNEAQKKVEGFYFDSRKHLLEYDDVLNKQRSAVYKRRKELLMEKMPPAVLSALDMLWMNQLESMDALRESVGMRAYAQHEPLVEYRRDSYQMYKNMMDGFEKWLEENKEKIEEMKKQTEENKNNPVSAVPVHSHNHEADKFKGVGRNDPCPCGAKNKDGHPIKFKHCHGK
jgi:preprotein translocase subunit SecA